MKPLFLLAFAIWSTSTFGQTPPNKTSGLIINSGKGLQRDTSLKVVYANKESNIKKPAYFLNDKLVSETLMGTLNPELIDNINVVNVNIQIDSIQYFGQIHIKTKSCYNPKLISEHSNKSKVLNFINKTKPGCSTGMDAPLSGTLWQEC